MTIGLYTNENQKNISRVLKTILRYIDNTNNELIIIDDLSEDRTIPKIVGIMGTRFIYEDQYKMHINTKKCGFEETKAKFDKIKTNDIIIYVDNKITKKELERMMINATNK